MANLHDFTQKNRRHTGAAGIKVSNDSLGNGDRVDEKGRLRFNDTTDLLEYYNGTSWKSIDAPPVITSFSINGGSNVTSGESRNAALNPLLIHDLTPAINACLPTSCS